MSSLSYGLNITKKIPASKSIPAKRKAVFEQDDSETEVTANNAEDGAEEIGVFGDAPSTGQRQPHPQTVDKNGSKKKGKPSIPNYEDISMALTSKKHSKEAMSLDPSIYDYDAAYDALHSTSAKKDAAKAEDAASRKPKYMSNLLAAAEVRKRDQLRAKEKLLMKEREAEGDEFADKEKFVTEAYKEQQKEVQRLEEEERLREEEEQRRRKGKGMTGFYRNVLERDEKKHEEAMAAAEKAIASSSAGEKQTVDEPEKELTEADLARKLKAQGRDITINDEGQVVDKRQLLSAGLNIAPKPQANQSKSATQSTTRLPAQTGSHGKGASQRAMRERQTRMLEEQLLHASQQAAVEEEEKKAALERAAKSKKTGSEISSAKERYLQRKREAELAKAEGRNDQV